MDGLSGSDVDVCAESASEEAVTIPLSGHRRAERMRNSPRSCVVGDRDRARGQSNGVLNVGELRTKVCTTADVTRARGMMAES